MIEIITADITKLNVGVIDNAAKSSLLGDGERGKPSGPPVAVLNTLGFFILL